MFPFFDKPEDLGSPEACLIFEPAQKKEYLQPYLARHGLGREGQDHALQIQNYVAKIAAVPGLEELMQTPLLFHMAIQALPALQKFFPAPEKDLAVALALPSSTSSSDRMLVSSPPTPPTFSSREEGAILPRPTSRVTRVCLYDIFSANYFSTQAQAYPLEEISMAAVLRDRAQRVALAMARARVLEIPDAVHPPPSAAPPFSENISLSQLLSHPPLKIKYKPKAYFLQRSMMGTNYCFMPSFLTYFIARGIWNALSLKPSTMNAELILSRGLRSDFILDNPTVISFLKELTVEEPEAVANFGGWIEHTQKFRTAADVDVSSCAATLLNALNIPFARFNLQNTRWGAANIRQGLLADVDFTGADISRLQARRGSFSRSILNKGKLSETNFEQSPWIALAGSITTMAPHPSRPLVAIASGEDIILWDLSTDKMKTRWHAHKAKVTGLVFSAGRIYSGAEDGTLCYWTEPGEGKSLIGHKAAINCLIISTKGLLASGCQGGHIRVLDQRGMLIHSFEAQSAVKSLLFNEPHQLISGSLDRKIRFWNLSVERHYPRAEKILQGHTGAVISLAICQGILASIGAKERAIWLWDMASGQKIGSLEGHTHPVTCLAVSQSGQLISAGGNDWTIRTWDVKEHRQEGLFKGHLGKVNCLALNNEGKVFSGSEDKTIRTWDVNIGSLRLLQESETQAIAFAGQACLLVCEENAKCLSVWDTKSSRPGWGVAAHDKRIEHFAVDPQGGLLASISKGEKDIRIWNIVTGKEVSLLGGHTDLLTCLVFGPGGQLASSSLDNTIRIWAPLHPGEGRVLVRDTHSVTQLVWGVHEQLVSGHGDGKIRIWDSRGQQICSMEGHAKGVRSLSMDLSGAWLASAGEEENEILIWKMKTRQLKHRIKGHTHAKITVIFSPNGDLISNSYSSETIRFWNAQTGEPRPQPEIRSSSPIYAMAVSEKGELALGRYDGRIDVFANTVNKYVLQWSSGPSQALAATKANLKGAQGLNHTNTMLFEQLEAVGRPRSSPALERPPSVFAPNLLCPPSPFLDPQVPGSIAPYLNLGRPATPSAGSPASRVAPLSQTSQSVSAAAHSRLALQPGSPIFDEEYFD
jgi:WD40 repeat protein